MKKSKSIEYSIVLLTLIATVAAFLKYSNLAPLYLTVLLVHYAIYFASSHFASGTSAARVSRKLTLASGVFIAITGAALIWLYVDSELAYKAAEQHNAGLENDAAGTMFSLLLGLNVYPAIAILLLSCTFAKLKQRFVKS